MFFSASSLVKNVRKKTHTHMRVCEATEMLGVLSSWVLQSIKENHCCGRKKPTEFPPLNVFQVRYCTRSSLHLLSRILSSLEPCCRTSTLHSCLPSTWHHIIRRFWSFYVLNIPHHSSTALLLVSLIENMLRPAVFLRTPQDELPLNSERTTPAAPTSRAADLRTTYCIIFQPTSKILVQKSNALGRFFFFLNPSG